MSRHRAPSPRRRAVPAAGHRRAEPGHPRYGRVAVLGASVSVTGIALLGAVGVLPSVASDGGADEDTVHDDVSAAGSLLSAVTRASPTPTPTPTPTQAAPQSSEPAAPATPPVPADSGEGRRVVFDQSDQRVWLVDEGEAVARTYLVSGSLSDNLDPGTYAVYSRSERAWGVDDSGTMRYFVRFTEGDAGAAIGFHDIPVDDGSPVQSVAQLGTPQSHGCIRQDRADAVALWDFAPVGTEVDVTA
jgi:L,D-transpeptidase-like protein